MTPTDKLLWLMSIIACPFVVHMVWTVVKLAMAYKEDE